MKNFPHTLRTSPDLLMALTFAVVYGFIGVECALLAIGTPLSVALLMALIVPAVAAVGKGVGVLLDDTGDAR